MSSLGANEPAARYRAGLLDWLACAAAGRSEPASHAAIEGQDITERVFAAGVAGHVLDYDDTYLPGLAHLSAPTAPAAVVVGAALDARVGAVLEAYAAGFEAMAAVARASHPSLYESGWHPTAVCGVVGAATAAARLLDLDAACEASAIGIALLGAGGLRAAFGSDGKSLQVGMAAATGVRAARLARSGATVPGDVLTGPAGFEAAYGATWAEPDSNAPAVADNWIKAYPCCLQTHSAIEAATLARAQGASSSSGGTVTVHPVSRQAAPLDDVSTGLEAKFSIPYLVAFTLLRGAPGLDDFARVDADVSSLAAGLKVDTAGVDESAALLEIEGRVWKVPVALGSPQRPLDETQMEAKVRSLAGTSLDGVLDDPAAPARRIVEAADLG